MARLQSFALYLEIALGVGAFAALFSSDFPGAEQFLYGASLLLIIFTIEVNVIDSTNIKERSFRGLLAVLESLEDRIDGKEGRKSSEALEAAFKGMEIHQMAGGQGGPYVFGFIVRYVGWIVGGWLLAKYVVPLWLTN